MTIDAGSPPTTAAGYRILRSVAEDHRSIATGLGRAREFDTLLGPQIDPSVADALPSHAWLLALLRGPRQAREDAAVALESAVRAVGEADRQSVVAVMARGLAPHGALATVPPGSLFTIEEQDEITRHPLPARVTSRVDLRQPVGRPLDYAGYLCVILKVTRACNLRCSYCTDWRAGPNTTMSFAALVRSVQQALGTGAAAVDIVLHGGEPLLLRRRLIQLLALQEHFAAPGTIVRTHVQTNGTMLDPRVRALLALFDMRVSVSVDGTRELHDRTRRDKRGNSTWDSVCDGIHALREDGTLAGVLTVVTPDTLAADPRELWGDLVSTGTPSVCFLAERPEPGVAARVSRAEYVRFLLRMEHERRVAASEVSIREVDSALRVIAGQQSGFCELAGNCVGHFISVDPDGSVSHCDKYLGDDAYVLGNLMRQELPEILRSPRVVALTTTAQQDVERLQPCRWASQCQGWCPHERYVDSSWADEGCCGLAALFDHLETAVAPVGR